MIPSSVVDIHSAKEVIFRALREEGIFDRLESIISKSLPVGPLGEKWKVQDILESLEGENRWIQSSRLSPVSEHEFRLHVALEGGSAFVDALEQEMKLGVGFNDVSGNSRTSLARRDSFIVSIAFGSGRGWSDSTALSVEPAFRGHFVFDISNLSSSSTSIHSFLENPRFLTLCVFRLKNSGRRVLVGATQYDIRKAMPQPLFVSLPLTNSAGIVHVRIGISSFHRHCPNLDTIEEMMREQEIVRKDRSRSCDVQFRNFQNTLVQHQHLSMDRPILFFVQDEFNRRRSVLSYLSKMDSRRLLRSPQQAARFVALIPVSEDESLISSSSLCMSMTSFLCCGRGPLLSHSILLSNLLLGFGLDAWVVYGLRKDKLHFWVATFHHPVDTSANSACWFWEPLTGMRFHLTGNEAESYTEVYEIFTLDRFLYNIGPLLHPREMVWNLDDKESWSSFGHGNSDLVEREAVCVLQPSSLDFRKLELDLEHSLKSLISEFREGEGLSVAWDPSLSQLLLIAADGYENELCSSFSSSAKISPTSSCEMIQFEENCDFQEALAFSLPPSSVFRASQICTQLSDSQRLFHALLRHEECCSILRTSSSNTYLALTVALYPYPENFASCWVLVAARSDPDNRLPISNSMTCVDIGN